jgi:RNA 2',3'-cyclic 3'-phosphodiesterase
MRLFIGIPIEGGQLEGLARELPPLRHAFPAARWVKPQNLHLTVRFLGEAGERDLPVIGDWLRAAVDPVGLGAVQLEKPGWFERRGEFVLWLGVRATPQLQSLARRLSGPVASIPAEPRAWTPHVTLARYRWRSREQGQWEDFTRAFQRLNVAQYPPEPARVVLFESRLGGTDGAEYREWLSVPER